MSVSNGLASVVSPEALVPSDDFLAGAEFGGDLMAVVQPASTAEVAAIMSWADREGVGVLPTCSGERAPRVPSKRPYVVLSTKRLDGMELYEAGDLTLTAQAGTPITVVDADASGLPAGEPIVDPHLSSDGSMRVAGTELRPCRQPDTHARPPLTAPATPVVAASPLFVVARCTHARPMVLLRRIQ